MIKQILKTVLAGILAGVALFMMPFLLIKVLIFFLLIKAIFRLLGGRRRHHHWQYAYAHKYKNMSEEERAAFTQKYGNRCGWNSKWESHNCGAEDGEAKKEDKTTNV
ncbi:MAG: hypothetical protein H0W73_00910 [Bacteroidetes bacterium]|nr:hypothetical protein [Bacteroidota bacterium]